MGDGFGFCRFLLHNDPMGYVEQILDCDAAEYLCPRFCLIRLRDKGEELNTEERGRCIAFAAASLSNLSPALTQQKAQSGVCNC